jgi:hypothetical protein
MLEVNRDAAAAGEEQLVSCKAEQSKYTKTSSISAFRLFGGSPFTSRARTSGSCAEACLAV